MKYKFLILAILAAALMPFVGSGQTARSQVDWETPDWKEIGGSYVFQFEGGLNGYCLLQLRAVYGDWGYPYLKYAANIDGNWQYHFSKSGCTLNGGHFWRDILLPPGTPGTPVAGQPWTVTGRFDSYGVKTCMSLTLILEADRVTGSYVAQRVWPWPPDSCRPFDPPEVFVGTITGTRDGAMSHDVDCDDLNDTSVEVERTVPVGSTFNVCTRATRIPLNDPRDPSNDGHRGYNAYLSWDEEQLGLNEVNDLTGCYFRSYLYPGRVSLRARCAATTTELGPLHQATLECKAPGDATIRFYLSPGGLGSLAAPHYIGDIVPYRFASNHLVRPSVNTWDLTVHCEEAADLLVDLADGPDPLLPGEVLTYNLLLTNEGQTAVDDVRVTDFLPDEVIFRTTTCPAPSFGSGVLTFDLATVGPNSTFSCDITVEVKPVARGSVVNQVHVLPLNQEPIVASAKTGIWELQSVQGQSPAWMGEPYRVQAIVNADTDTDSPAPCSSLQFQETSASYFGVFGAPVDELPVWFKDHREPEDLPVLLCNDQQGVQSTYALTVNHDWEWIQPPNSAIVSLQVALGQIPGGVGTVISGLSTIDDLLAAYSAIPSAQYEYRVDPTFPQPAPLPQATCDDPNDDPTCTVVPVSVHPVKVDSLEAFTVQSVSCFFGGIPAAFLRGHPATAALAGICSGVAHSHYRNAYDPDPAYAEIAVPESLRLSIVDGLPAGAERDALEGYLEHLSLMRAFESSFVRYLGAVAAGDDDWAYAQLNASLRYSQLASAKLQEVLPGLRAIIDVVGPLSGEDVIDIQQGIGKKGLPDELVQALVELGFSDAEIADITDLMATVDLSVGLNPDDWDQLGLQNVALLDEMAGDLAGELPEDPPADGDGDTIPDTIDSCPDDFDPTHEDLDGDGLGDVCDPDDDNDGVLDVNDACPNTPLGVPVDAHGCSAEQALRGSLHELQVIVDSNPGTELADKVEDALAKAQTSLDELNKTPPDNQAAVGNIEGAVGDLEAAIKDGLLDPVQGTFLMDRLVGAARLLAVEALDQAIALPGDPDAIRDAQEALDEGDALRAAGAYKDAVDNYKDALAKAESTL